MPSSPQTVTTRGVFDYLYDTAGKAMANRTVNVTLNFNGASVTSPIVNVGELQQATTTDQNGFWRFNLIPNDTLTPTGTLYTIVTPNASYDISVPSGVADVQSSSILANTPSVLSPALTNLTGPITVTGNETVTGNLTVSGTTTLGSTTTGATTTGALSTGAITAGGDLTISSAFRLLFGAAAAKIIPGATSISHRNNADSADNLLITDAGDITVRARLLLATAIGKIIPGATSISLRNNADSADNLLLADAGAITARGTITANDFQASGATGGQIPLRMFSLGTVITGATATLATAKFLVQAFSTVGATDAGGHLTITYPTAFPNGIYSIVASPGDTAGGLIFLTPAVAANLTSYVITGWGQSAGAVAVLNTQTIRVNTVAIGW